MVKKGMVEILRGIVRMQVAIFAIAFFAISGVTTFSLVQRYRLTEAHDRALVSAHLDDAATNLRKVATDFGIWDKAVEMVAQRDLETMDRELTGYLFNVHDLDLALVIDTAGHRLGVAERADYSGADLEERLTMEIARLLAHRNDRVAGQKNAGGAAVWVMLGDTPHLVALSPIYTAAQFETRTLPARLPWLVLARALDASYLNEIAERYSLQDAAVTAAGAGGFNNAFPLRMNDGTIPVQIAWNSRPIGVIFVLVAVPLMLASTLLLVAFSWRVIRRTQAMGHSMDSLHRETQRERGRLRSMFDSAHDFLLVHDAAQVIVDCNNRLCEQLGYSRAALIGRPVDMVVAEYPADSEATADTVGALRAASGAEIPVEINVGRFGDADERMFLISARDISTRLEAEKTIWHQAHFDALTDLPNRILFCSEFSAALAEGKGGKIACALLFVDLDGFKAVNDTHGHEAGDALLRAVADRFRAHLRRTDVVARLGGDEFGLVLRNIRSVEDGTRIAAGLVDRLARPYDLEQARVKISASIGIAFAPDDGRTTGALLSAADMAMYDVKRAGGGAWRLAGSIDAAGAAPVRKHATRRAMRG